MIFSVTMISFLNCYYLKTLALKRNNNYLNVRILINEDVAENERNIPSEK